MVRVLNYPYSVMLSWCFVPYRMLISSWIFRQLCFLYPSLALVGIGNHSRDVVERNNGGMQTIAVVFNALDIPEEW